MAWAPGFTVKRVSLTGPGRVDVTLSNEAVTRGQLVREDGAPWEGRRMVVAREAEYLYDPGGPQGGITALAWTDDQGAFVLAGTGTPELTGWRPEPAAATLVAPGTWRLTVESAGENVEPADPLPPADPLSLAAPLEPQEAATSTTPALLRVSPHAADATVWWGTVTTDALTFSVLLDPVGHRPVGAGVADVMLDGVPDQAGGVLVGGPDVATRFFGLMHPSDRVPVLDARTAAPGTIEWVEDGVPWTGRVVWGPWAFVPLEAPGRHPFGIRVEGGVYTNRYLLVPDEAGRAHLRLERLVPGTHLFEGVRGPPVEVVVPSGEAIRLQR